MLTYDWFLGGRTGSTVPLFNRSNLESESIQQKNLSSFIQTIAVTQSRFERLFWLPRLF